MVEVAAVIRTRSRAQAGVVVRARSSHVSDLVNKSGVTVYVWAERASIVRRCVQRGLQPTSIDGETRRGEGDEAVVVGVCKGVVYGWH